MKTTTHTLRNLINRSPLRAFLLIPLTVACFALSPTAQAVDPPPDGGYPGDNTAEGTDALFSLTGGTENTALGADALYYNAGGTGNTAVGHSTLLSNTSGDDNTAIGVLALFSNTLGSHNTASGDFALYSNTSGDDNTADGHFALFHNITGPRNTATGHGALFFNTTGAANTASGFNALLHNTTGSGNIALGALAGTNLRTGNRNIDIGNAGVTDESNTIRIGNVANQNATFIAGISGAAVAGGVGVIIDSSGHLGTVVSSERFKDEIKPMDKASEAILALNPVTFRYKHELDPDGIPQFGLVAEQVAKVDPDLVARDDHGKPYTVRYEAVNAMLLNEFLKEHRKVGEQEATIVQLKKDFQATATHQQEQIEALTAGLQKVSAQVGMRKPAPQVVNNNQ
ncbi:MAG: hypothetical protein DME56_12840 [Verrucomicrobia bacterium]|nr:MAG: hypothetical protein DME56_12840 [Verrucomicrobiota bacterium]